MLNNNGKFDNTEKLFGAMVLIALALIAIVLFFSGCSLTSQKKEADISLECKECVLKYDRNHKNLSRNLTK